MTPTQRKALAVWNEVRRERGASPWPFEDVKNASSFAAICRLIDEHEAFKQEVSEVCETAVNSYAMSANLRAELSRFIIPKPDPVAVALSLASSQVPRDTFAERLAARGLKIVEATDD